MYNLRNRSFVKEIDFTARELEHLLELAEAAYTFDGAVPAGRPSAAAAGG